MPKYARLGKLPAVIALLAATVLASCGTAEPSPAPTSSPGTPPASIDASGGPSGSPSPEASDASPPSESPSVTEPPSEPATASAGPTASASPEPTESVPAGPGQADACTVSNDANREFLVRVASSVEWPMLCAVLPAHWLLLNGSYHLAHGGEVVIDYGGPGGATLNLQQGGFCSDSSGCVPAGADAGDAALGPFGGSLVELDDGGYSIVVDRGASPSWLMTVHGVDQATAISFGAAMVKVGS
jgi:hypothetical protein